MSQEGFDPHLPREERGLSNLSYGPTAPAPIARWSNGIRGKLGAQRVTVTETTAIITPRPYPGAPRPARGAARLHRAAG